MAIYYPQFLLLPYITPVLLTNLSKGLLLLTSYKLLVLTSYWYEQAIIINKLLVFKLLL